MSGKQKTRLTDAIMQTISTLIYAWCSVACWQKGEAPSARFAFWCFAAAGALYTILAAFSWSRFARLRREGATNGSKAG